MLNTNWDNLRIFLAVARHRSAVEAAGQLSLDHSTVTRRLKTLERELGTQLFERNTQGHLLTAAGQRLLHSVESIENTLSVIDSQVGHDNHVLTGSVRLGATEGFGSFFLAPQVSGFCELHPSITVDLLAVPRYINLSKREADLAVNIDRPSTGAYVVAKLSDYRLQVYATEQYLADHAPIRELKDIAGHRMIGYIDELAYSEELRYLDALAPDAVVQLRSTSIAAQFNAARRSQALAILPCFMASLCQDLVPVLPGVASILRTFWLVTPQEHRGIARVRALWDYLREAAEINRDFLLGRVAEVRYLDAA